MHPTDDDLEPDGVADIAEDTDPLMHASDEDPDYDPFTDYPDESER